LKNLTFGEEEAQNVGGDNFLLGYFLLKLPEPAGFLRVAHGHPVCLISRQGMNEKKALTGLPLLRVFKRFY
jgi:hypothetical protein